MILKSLIDSLLHDETARCYQYKTAVSSIVLEFLDKIRSFIEIKCNLGCELTHVFFVTLCVSTESRRTNKLTYLTH